MGSHRSGGTRSSAACRSAGGAIFALAVLAGCPTVDLGDTPTDLGLCNPTGGLAYFEDVVWPQYIRHDDATNGCTRAGGCHNEAGGNALSFKTQPAPDFTFNFTHAKNFLNCGTPRQSDLLTKPLAGEVAHGGGEIFSSDSDPAVTAFLDWFQ